MATTFLLLISSVLDLAHYLATIPLVVLLEQGGFLALGRKGACN